MQVSVFIATSLNGQIANKDNNIDFLNIAALEGEDYGHSKFMQNVDCMIMGRNTYDFIAHAVKTNVIEKWPFADKKLIVLTNKPMQPIANEIAMSGDLKNIIRELKNENIKKVYIDGGNIISQAINEYLITDLIITILPIIIEDGMPLFKNIKQDTNLTLKSSQSYKSGVVQVCYDVTA